MTGYFIFDDIDTRDFEDVYVYFDKVDETPKRVYTKVDIPARNGAFYIDENRYEDVEHIYHIAALTKEAGSALINALASKIGYYRLEDSFNPTEYYQAVFTSGAEPKISSTRDKNTFKVTFTRKPQRWLTSGETEVAVDSGDTLTNPTLFESSPLLKFKGYGAIEFNGYEIGIDNVPLGEIQLWGIKYPSFYPPTFEKVYTFDTTHLVSGDSIYFKDDPTTTEGIVVVDIIKLDTPQSGILEAGQVTSQINVVKTVEIADASNVTCRLRPDLSSGFTYGTPSTISASATFNYFYKGVVCSSLLSVSVVYDGNDTITITPSRTATYPSGLTPRNYMTGGVGVLLAYSSEPAITDYVYCDTDIGEFYRMDGGEYISMNHVGDLGSDLPTLAPGTNTVTYDNTITELNIVPRWWKI